MLLILLLSSTGCQESTHPLSASVSTFGGLELSPRCCIDTLCVCVDKGPTNQKEKGRDHNLQRADQGQVS